MSGMDRDLGMGRPIGRRDFVNGTAVALGGSLLPKWSWALALDAQAAGQGATDDLPAAPHRHARQPRGLLRGRAPAARRRDLARPRRPTPASATTWSSSAAGISGLAAAYFFRRRRARRAHPDPRQPRRLRRPRQAQRVRRDGRMLMLNGGTLNIESPLQYSQRRDGCSPAIGIDLERFERRQRGRPRPLPRLGLRSGVFFNKETFGVDRLVVGPAGAAPRRRVAASSCERRRSPSRRSPTSRGSRAPTSPTTCPGCPRTEKKQQLMHMSYSGLPARASRRCTRRRLVLPDAHRRACS